MDSEWMELVTELLTERKIQTIRFEFPYMASRRSGKKRPPDRLNVLQNTWKEDIETCGSPEKLVIDGKSMGGRMSTHLASTGLGDGVLGFGYPLVAFGKGEPRDTSHFDDIQVPALFVQGTRDKLAPLELLRPAVARLSPGEIHEIADADHSYRVPKRTGRTSDEVIAEVVNASVAWAKER